jgi:DDE family transposase
VYLRKVAYQLGVRVQSLVPCFHKSHLKNLALLVVGIAYSKSVSLPKAAGAVPYKRIQIESRVERFERLLQCEKLIPLDVLKPVARKVLKSIYRNGRGEIRAAMDRTMINDTINLLFITAAYNGRALPLGWVRVPHEGNSDLKLQKRLLKWFAECLPEGARRRTTIIADREFHSIHLATWIETTLKLNFALRIKAGTCVEYLGDWYNAGDLATRGRTRIRKSIKVTTDGKATHRVNLAAVWDRDQEEPWLLITNLTDAEHVREIYSNRFWIEEMFSDHKSRGLNLESTRLTDPDRIERLLVAVTLAYLWIMEVGVFVVTSGQWRQVDNRGASRSVSLCQIGLRWLSERLNLGFLPPLLSGCFKPLEAA